MPLKRTPPMSPAPLITAAGSSSRNRNITILTETPRTPKESQQYESEPDLHSIVANVTERKKTKTDGESTDFLALFQQMFSSFSKEQEKRFQDIKSSIDLLSNKYDEFLSKITVLEKERQTDKATIQELEEKLEILERKSRASGIEIRNLPKQSGETKDNLINEVVLLGKTLDMNIDKTTIKDIYRLKSKDSSDPVVVSFTTVPLKENILRAVKTFNRSKPKGNKLNTTHLNPNYKPKAIYIAETLTQKTQRIYYLARQFQKSHGYSFCWTTNGIVYLKKNEGSPHIRINQDSELEKLRKELITI